jgi:hypothetical protein
MSNVSQWDNAAANNNDTPPDGWPEGQAPSTVNDCARELMASVSRWYDDQKGELVTAGSSNAYTLTTNSTHAALADQSLLVFRADRANTGAATLNVDSLGAKSMRINGAALASGNLVADVLYAAVYNATDDAYDLQCGLTASMVNTDLGLGTMSTQAASSVAITGGTIDGVAITGGSVDGDALGYKYKTAGTVRTTEALSDDPHLAGWSLTAGEWYAVEGMLDIQNTAGSSSTFQGKFDFTNTYNNAGRYSYWYINNDGDFDAADADNFGFSIFVIEATSGNFGAVNFRGVFQANSTTGGTVDFQWHESASGEITLAEGSWISIRRIS